MVNHRIAVFSTPRTKSSFVCESVCEHYGAVNHSELWTGVISAVQRIPLPNTWDNWRSKVKYMNNRLFTEYVTFGYKVWAPAFIHKFQFLSDRESFLKKPNVTFNLTETFRFDDFTEFYILKRNTTDMVCSWLHARETKVWGYKDLDDVRKNHPLYYTTDIDKNFEQHKNLVDWLIYSATAIDRIEPYLQTLNKPYYVLNFDEIPTFILNKFNVKSDFIPNDFKYSDVVKNYSLIDEYVQEKKELFSKHTQTFNFY